MSIHHDPSDSTDSTATSAAVEASGDGHTTVQTTTPTPAQTTARTDDSYARKAVLASAIGYGLDGFDLLILSFALTGIIAAFGITDTQAGLFTTLTLLGAVTGGFVFGLLSDRFGRVRMLTWSVVLFSVFTGLSRLRGARSISGSTGSSPGSASAASSGSA